MLNLLILLRILFIRRIDITKEIILWSISNEYSFKAGITGAVIGTLGTAGTIRVLIFFIAIVVIAIFTSIMRKRQTSR